MLGKVDIAVGRVNRWLSEGFYRITLIPNSTIAILTSGDGCNNIDYADPANPKRVQQINTGVCSGLGRTYSSIKCS
jgi:hypothetical protein